MPNENKPSKAEAVRTYLSSHPRAKPKKVVEALAEEGIQVDARYASKIKSQKTSRPKKTKAKRIPKKTSGGSGRRAKYPRHNLERALRIPKGACQASFQNRPALRNRVQEVRGGRRTGGC